MNKQAWILRRWALSLILLCSGQCARAAQGEMGAGIPNFGMYSAGTGLKTLVWNLANQTTGFPSGCPQIVLTPATMGMDAYKMAIATMLVSKSTNNPVRFYAHAERDGGCGVDYVQLLN